METPMPSRILRHAVAASIGLSALAAPMVAQAALTDHHPSQPAGGCTALFAGDQEFSRTELFFGLSRANGPDITEAQFDGFVDHVISDRFPDGLTVVDGTGKFKNAAGKTIEEPSRLVILLYPPGDPTSSDRIEDIRTRYKKRFDQESVLRVDDETCVSF
jgi:hypothetical protein